MDFIINYDIKCRMEQEEAQAEDGDNGDALHKGILGTLYTRGIMGTLYTKGDNGGAGDSSR